MFTIDDETIVILALPSSSGEGRYLTAAAFVKGKIVVGHDCPAAKVRKTCWHTAAAVNALKNFYFYKSELDDAEVISIYRKVTMSEEWRQIQIPEKIGVRTHEQHTA